MANYVANGTTGEDVIQDANWHQEDFVKSSLLAGNDIFIGWGARYLVYGGGGDDRISSGFAGGTAYGGTGDDRIELQATGKDHIGHGDDGNDLFFAWFNIGGSISCYGDNGIDRFDDAHAGSSDLFDGGSGFDYVIDINSKEGISVSLIAGAGSGGSAASNTYVSIEGLSGSAHADLLTGNDDDNVLLGARGNDTLNGGNGDDLLIGDDFFNFFILFTGARAAPGSAANTFSYADSSSMNNQGTDDDGAGDVLSGGAGNDVLIGGFGADTLNGGIGTDTANYIDSDTGVTVKLSTGATAGDSATGDILISVENLLGSELNDTLVGSVAANALRGRAGDDALTGGKGVDSLQGDLGNDTLDGGLGDDTMTGGSGDDTYIVDSEADVVKESAGAGIDTVRSNVTHKLASAVDHLVLTGAAAIDGAGNILNNAITGNSRANDLDGQLGADTLTGGLGADQFTFSTKLDAAANVDVIDDYTVAADSIVLKQTAFAGLALGELNADAFVIGAAAADKEDRIIYNESSGALLFDRDGVKIRYGAVQFATLDAGLAMTNSEFTIA